MSQNLCLYVINSRGTICLGIFMHWLLLKLGTVQLALVYCVAFYCNVPSKSV